MEISGSLLLNSTEITDIDDYSNQIAYVMQDDILLATFTPTGTLSICFNILISART
jgi:ABC-type uncharacterized transport system YnjBCD ATPase subunit